MPMGRGTEPNVAVGPLADADALAVAEVSVSSKTLALAAPRLGGVRR